MIQFAERTMTILQLIELEPLNLSDAYYERYHLDLNEIEQRLKEQALEVRTREYMQNRRIYFLPRVKVEVIHPIENTEFCARCTRIRVTSDGKLKALPHEKRQSSRHSHSPAEWSQRRRTDKNSSLKH